MVSAGDSFFSLFKNIESIDRQDALKIIANTLDAKKASSYIVQPPCIFCIRADIRASNIEGKFTIDCNVYHFLKRYILCIETAHGKRIGYRDLAEETIRLSESDLTATIRAAVCSIYEQMGHSIIVDKIETVYDTRESVLRKHNDETNLDFCIRLEQMDRQDREKLLLSFLQAKRTIHWISPLVYYCIHITVADTESGQHRTGYAYLSRIDSDFVVWNELYDPVDYVFKREAIKVLDPNFSKLTKKEKIEAFFTALSNLYTDQKTGWTRVNIETEPLIDNLQ